MIPHNFSFAVPVIATANVLPTVRYFEQTPGFKQHLTVLRRLSFCPRTSSTPPAHHV